MTALTNHEQQEIDRANAEGKQPVVFVHGLWLLSSSWDNWRTLFEEQGYITLAPGWPDDPDTGEHDNTVPWAIAHASYKQQEKNPGVTEIHEIPDRGHSLVIDHGWREVAETALAFIAQHLQPVQ